MRTVKFFLVLALLVCLMEPCLVVAQRGGIGAGIRFAVISFLHSHIYTNGCYDIALSAAVSFR